MFKAIGGFAGRLFGTDKAAEKLIDNVSTGLDKLVYTDEEKSDAVAADRSEARKMMIDWMKSTQGQNLSRRLLALSTAFVWLSQYVIAGTMGFASIWVENPVTVEKLIESRKLLMDGVDQMSPVAMLVFGFYFAAPHMDKFVKPIADVMASRGKK